MRSWPSTYSTSARAVNRSPCASTPPSNLNGGIATDASNYEEIYLGFENETIDYGLIEKVDNLLVVPAAFDWMDLGSFGDIHKAVESDQAGNSVHGNKVALVDVENSLVQNYEDKPVAVIGLDNVAVINTPQGLVITRKDISQKVKDAVKQLEDRK